MSMVEVDHGGIVKRTIQPNDFLISEANSAINIDEDDLTADHGGVSTNPQSLNYNGIQIPTTPNIGVSAKFVPELPSNLIVDVGGPIKPRTIVNDEQ